MTDSDKQLKLAEKIAGKYVRRALTEGLAKNLLAQAVLEGMMIGLQQAQAIYKEKI